MPTRSRVSRYLFRGNPSLLLALSTDTAWVKAGACGTQTRTSRIKCVLDKWVDGPKWEPGSPPENEQGAFNEAGSFELDLRSHHEAALLKASKEWSCNKTEALRRILWGWLARPMVAETLRSKPRRSPALPPAPG